MQKIKEHKGIFHWSSNFDERFVPNFKKLSKIVEHCKGLGLSVVLTQGTYDLVHIGHARYFESAKKHGDILIVGVDSDEKVRARKGPDRPIVPQQERLEMVTHMRSVDMVTLKEVGHPKWHLIMTVRPDVLIATKDTYSAKELRELKKYCGKIVVLDPMATTSTSAKIRLMQLKTAKNFERALTPKVISAISEVLGGERKK
jgi:D-glycero-beta-D-manno-heptose 1-phosphate adenylyltransferase